MGFVYDVNVFLTNESPDPDDDMLSGPLDCGFCETYNLFQNLAVECGGSWADWEPYRCTYSFPNKDKMNEFCKRAVNDGLWESRKVNIKQKVWERT